MSEFKKDRSRNRKNNAARGKRESEEVKENRPQIKILSEKENIPKVVELQKIQPTSWAFGKLINEQFEFCGEEISKLLSDNTDFTVIGVLGCQGVGKSHIMNHLCQNVEHKEPPFIVKTIENFILNKHQTVGIDIAITSDRLIIIDTQPLFSISVLNQLIKNDTKVSTDNYSIENYHELQSIEIGVFLFSICHIVLLVQDYVNDLNILKFVNTCYMLKSSISDLNTYSNNTDNIINNNNNEHQDNEYNPDLICIYNKIASDKINTTTIYNIQILLDRIITKSFQTKECIFSKSIINDQFANDFQLSNYSTQSHINFSIIPDFNNSTKYGYNTTDYETAMDQFLLNINSLTKKSISGNKTITERDWLKTAWKLWDTIKKSPSLNKYINLTGKWDVGSHYK